MPPSTFQLLFGGGDFGDATGVPNAICGFAGRPCLRSAVLKVVFITHVSHHLTQQKLVGYHWPAPSWIVEGSPEFAESWLGAAGAIYWWRETERLARTD